MPLVHVKKVDSSRFPTAVAPDRWPVIDSVPDRSDRTDSSDTGPRKPKAAVSRNRDHIGTDADLAAIHMERWRATLVYLTGDGLATPLPFEMTSKSKVVICDVKPL